jgi:hypothetical protein
MLPKKNKTKKKHGHNYSPTNNCATYDHFGHEMGLHVLCGDVRCTSDRCFEHSENHQDDNKLCCSEKEVLS